MLAFAELDQLIAVPKSVLKTVTKTSTIKYNIESKSKYNIESKSKYDKDSGNLEEGLEEVSDAITNKVIIPILESNVNNLEKVFEDKISFFMPRLEIMKLVFLRTFKIDEESEKLNLQKILNFEDWLYATFKEIINSKNIDGSIKNRLFSLILNLKEYDISLYKIIYEKKEIIHEALNVFDKDRLRNHITKCVLSFLSILFYLDYKNDIDDKKLLKLMTIAEDSMSFMNAFRDSIDILSEDKTKISEERLSSKEEQRFADIENGHIKMINQNADDFLNELNNIIDE